MHADDPHDGADHDEHADDTHDEADHDKHEEHAEDDHEGHDHGEEGHHHDLDGDPHFWTGPHGFGCYRDRYFLGEVDADNAFQEMRRRCRRKCGSGRRNEVGSGNASRIRSLFRTKRLATWLSRPASNKLACRV